MAGHQLYFPRVSFSELSVILFAKKTFSFEASYHEMAPLPLEEKIEKALINI